VVAADRLSDNLLRTVTGCCLIGSRCAFGKIWGKQYLCKSRRGARTPQVIRTGVAVLHSLFSFTEETIESW
jgi:hypothetical protein